jgi:hypothetical protein
MKISREQIIQFLCDEGISYKERSDRGELLVDSIFTSDSKKKMGINYKKNGAWNCFKSNEGGSFFKLIKILKKFDTETESKLFFIKNYFSKEDLLESFYSPSITEKTKNVIEIPESYSPLKEKNMYYDYLILRHFNEEIINESKVFFSTFEKRVLFPIYENNELCFYAKRSVDPNNPLRWVNSISEGSDPVWNLQNVGSEIFIFEGIFDAIRVWPRGVAIFGNTIREGQLEKILAKNPYKIVVVLDGDEAGRRGQLNTAKKISQKHSNVWVHLWDPEGPKDFSDMKEVKINPLLFDAKGELLYKFFDAVR